MEEKEGLRLEKAEYAILRFKKYKGPEISNIEAHNERRKEKYASNPDVDPSRSRMNFHLIEPQDRYRAEAERQISAAGCRTRKDSVRVVEVLVTASPEFFHGKNKREIREFFQYALDFLTQHQKKETILSAVVHMDEKTPHMHVSFVPLTGDGRLSAKDIVGNKKKLIWWQDEFWKYMVSRYPELERGESASKTGRDHIPPRVFKQMTQLTKQKELLEKKLNSINPLNAKKQAEEISRILESYIPAVEKMDTQLKKYQSCYQKMAAENRNLKEEKIQLSEELEKAQGNSTLTQIRELKLRQDYQDALDVLARIPTEIRDMYNGRNQDINHRNTR